MKMAPKDGSSGLQGYGGFEFTSVSGQQESCYGEEEAYTGDARGEGFGDYVKEVVCDERGPHGVCEAKFLCWSGDEDIS